MASLQGPLKSLENVSLPLPQPPQKTSNPDPPHLSPLLSLPSEILLQIARLVLILPDFHISNPESAKASEATGAYDWNTGCGYLLTCRRAYIEGLPIFYTQNTIYLPHGPIEHTDSYLAKNLPPKFRALGRRFSMHLSLSDLAPADIERCFQRKHSAGAHAVRQLVKVWTKKAARVMGQWPPAKKFDPAAVPTMEMVCIPGSEGAVLGRSRLSPRWLNAAPEVQVAVGKSTAWVRWVVGRKMSELGKEGTRKWLLKVVGGGGGEGGDPVVVLGK